MNLMWPQHFCFGERAYGDSRRKFGKKGFEFDCEMDEFEVSVRCAGRGSS